MIRGDKEPRIQGVKDSEKLSFLRKQESRALEQNQMVSSDGGNSEAL